MQLAVMHAKIEILIKICEKYFVRHILYEVKDTHVAKVSLSCTVKAENLSALPLSPRLNNCQPPRRAPSIL